MKTKPVRFAKRFRGTLLLIAATIGLLCGGCCAGAARCHRCTCSACRYDCSDGQSAPPATIQPSPAANANSQPTGVAALVPPPNVPAAKVALRSSLFPNPPKGTPAVKQEPASLNAAAQESTPSTEFQNPISGESNPSRDIPTTRDIAPENSPTDDSFTDPSNAWTDPITSAESATPASTRNEEATSTKPSNTLILEISAEPESDSLPVDSGPFVPAQEELPQPGFSLDSEFSAALQVTGSDHPETNDPTTPRIMFAVPPLYPTEIPPIVRIVKIESSSMASRQPKPYSLTTAPATPGSQAQPIGPVLEALRVGRPTSSLPSAATIRR